ncbi:MAG: hypothetical protein Q7T16_02020 [Candidatus Burarchaeum sp.]|nr:hypothetical protein [Candidatus Burarchaeum sp.]MDO8339410.1 hypothetical protein [Candidatus Burarchaeum sp.]
MTIDTRIIKAKILQKLARMNKWEHSHTALENLSKSFPKHLRGMASQAANELIREGYLHLKPTGYGKHVSLNIAKKKEIDGFIAQIGPK